MSAPGGLDGLARICRGDRKPAGGGMRSTGSGSSGCEVRVAADGFRGRRHRSRACGSGCRRIPQRERIWRGCELTRVGIGANGVDDRIGFEARLSAAARRLGLPRLLRRARAWARILAWRARSSRQALKRAPSRRDPLPRAAGTKPARAPSQTSRPGKGKRSSTPSWPESRR